MVMILVAVVASVTKFQVVRSSSLRMDVFDVGHGLSVLLSINGRGLYDKGRDIFDFNGWIRHHTNPEGFEA